MKAGPDTKRTRPYCISLLSRTMAEPSAGLTDHATYEAFLDSQVAPIDLFYLEDEDVARQLVELGYRGNGEAVKREDFLARKAAAEAQRNAKAVTDPKPLTCSHPDVAKTPLVAALAEREQANRDGKLATIIYVRLRNARGQEVSGYVDYSQRLLFEDMTPFFIGTRALLPKHTDLSFYNWETQTSLVTASENFEIVTDAYQGLVFKSKLDRKMINVDPKKQPGDYTNRVKIEDPAYIQVVLYDHTVRQKP
eukprot:m.142617 g.142617  ORF g.142617 m.142617 type:complete len:251 (-) comp9651_c0_seq2:2460-3212(-)